MKLQLIDEKEFAALSDPQKRVAIAKDVLARIEARVIVPVNECLFTNKGDVLIEDGPDWTISWGKSAQPVLNAAACQVCAKGALVCSWVGNFNKYTRSQVYDMSYDFDDGFYPEELIELFGRVQLDLIEHQFEQGLDGKSEEPFRWTCSEAAEYPFKKEYHKNLSLIMENIVKNNGEFIP